MIKNSSSKKIWLALRFSQLPLDVYWNKINESQDSEMPIAVIDQNKVTHCNFVAKNYGVKPGMDVVSATALSTNLMIINRDIYKEKKSISHISQLLYNWTPEVVVDSKDTILLELSGCLLLFKGLKPIIRGVQHELSEQGYGFQMGIAHTPKAACLLSYENRKTVASCFDFSSNILLENVVSKVVCCASIERLSLFEPVFSARLLKACANMGLRSIGDLIGLPKADLKQRLGVDVVVCLEKLTGSYPDLKIKITPKMEFHKTIFFMEGLTNTQMIMFPMKRLLADFSVFLNKRQLHCRSFNWVFEHDNSFNKDFSRNLKSNYDVDNDQISTLIIPLSQPKNSAADFLELTQLKLTRFLINSPIESITIYSESLQIAEHEMQSWLEPVSQCCGDLGSLIDRLRNRLGDHSINGLYDNGVHWPELTIQEKNDTNYLISNSYKINIKNNTKNKNLNFDKDESKKNKCTDNHKSNYSDSIRPIFLMEKPIRIMLNDNELYYQGKKIVLENTLERLEYSKMMLSLVRDYYIGAQADGVRYWVFYSPIVDAWYIHGIFS